jgi:hypothetical protein
MPIPFSTTFGTLPFCSVLLVKMIKLPHNFMPEVKASQIVIFGGALLRGTVGNYGRSNTTNQASPSLPVHQLAKVRSKGNGQYLFCLQNR